MKKYLPYIIIALIVIAAGTGIFFFIKSQSPKPKAGLKPPEAINTVPVTDRPYVTLAPTSAGKHPLGTEVAVTVHNTTLGATKAEYELEYQSGSLLQGAFGSLDLTMEKPPVTKVLLLGTCSAGGKCDYNKEVTGGTLLLRLTGQQKFAVKGEWSYQLMSERGGKFSSRDSKFRLDIGPKGLPASTYVILMQPMGLPAPVAGTLIAGPYHAASGEAASPKSIELSLRLTDPPAPVKLLGWAGNSWKEYKSTVADSTLTATVDRLTTFVVVQ